MAAFEFVKHATRNVLPLRGEIETPDMLAVVKYSLDVDCDKDVNLTIDEQYLKVGDLEYLIDFLTAVKKELA
jgi:hypothetical protein